MRGVRAVLAAGLLLPSVARAEIEIGGVAGLHTFSGDSSFGVVEDANGDPSPNATSLKNSALFAIRAGVTFGRIGAELEAGAIPTEPRDILFDVWSIVARAQVLYQLPPRVDGKLVPFALAGAGIIKIVDVGPPENEAIVEKDLMVVPYLGIGAKYRTSGGWGVRGDLRALYVSTVDGGVPLEVEALVSIYRQLGATAQKKPVEKPLEQVPVTTDPDRDGVVGAADRCPQVPEDRDGFEDGDGCPDPDNDKDGVADADDQCPTGAEDKDGFDDEDGCPDADNDGDTLLDAADKCPDQPETINGFDDEDGCPDEVPEALTKITGVVPGIAFQGATATLAPSSAKQLDAAAAVLVEHKTVGVEVSAHTDDVAPRAGGPFADNAALSQARADAVKAYLVKKGVEENRLVARGYGDTVPLEDAKPLTGAAQATARAKNRRVEFKLIQVAAPVPAP